MAIESSQRLIAVSVEHDSCFYLPDAETELVVHTEPRPGASEPLIRSVPAAIRKFVEAGGTLITGPFDIAIGQCAEVSDPGGTRSRSST